MAVIRQNIYLNRGSDIATTSHVQDRKYVARSIHTIYRFSDTSITFGSDRVIYRSIRIAAPVFRAASFTGMNKISAIRNSAVYDGV
jgi:hypothetical protein